MVESMTQFCVDGCALLFSNRVASTLDNRGAVWPLARPTEPELWRLESKPCLTYPSRPLFEQGYPLMLAFPSLSCT